MRTADYTDLRAWYIENIFSLLLGVSIAGSHGLSDDERRGFNLAVESIAYAFGIEYQEIKNGLNARHENNQP